MFEKPAEVQDTSCRVLVYITVEDKRQRKTSKKCTTEQRSIFPFRHINLREAQDPIKRSNPPLSAFTSVLISKHPSGFTRSFDMHFTKACIVCSSLAACSAAYLGPDHHLRALRAWEAYPEAFAVANLEAYAAAYPDAYDEEEPDLDDRGLCERHAEADPYPGAYAEVNPDAYAEEDNDLDDRDLYERYAGADAEAEPIIPNPIAIGQQLLGSLLGLGGGKDKGTSSNFERGLHERDAEAEAHSDPWDEEIDVMFQRREMLDPAPESFHPVPAESFNSGPGDQITDHETRFPYKPANKAGRLNPPHMRRYDNAPAPGNSPSIGAQQQAVGSAPQTFGTPPTPEPPGAQQPFGTQQAYGTNRDLALSSHLLLDRPPRLRQV